MSILYRRRHGKPIIPHAPMDALFVDRRASGHMNGNPLLRFAGARRCLIVAVTPGQLIVTPRFPFNLMFLPEIYGLEYTVNRRDIRSVIKLQGIFWVTLRVDFDTDRGARSMALIVKDPDKFLGIFEFGEV